MLFSIIKFVINTWFDYKKKSTTDETKRQEIEASKEVALTKVRGAVLSQGAFWFQLFFIVPLGFWWTSVLVYSIFWHKNGPFPYAGLDYAWDIAALPSPLNEWAAAMIGFLFLWKSITK